MTARTSVRLFDVATADRLSTLHAHALESGQKLNVDFDPYRVPKAFWIIQLFDQVEREILTGRGRTLADAVSELHERWLARGMGAA